MEAIEMLFEIMVVNVFALLGLMYWSPYFGLGFAPEPEPTPQEKYVQDIRDRLLRLDYVGVLEMLAKPKFPLQELPLAEFLGDLNRSQERVLRDVRSLFEKLPQISMLEKMLRQEP